MERNNSVDISKGIGIFLVIWAHTVCPFIPEISLFHMPLFFMLSGYVFNKRDSFRITLGKKIKTLLIPFAIFFFFQRLGFILISVAGGTYQNDYLIPWSVIPPWRVMGVLWFLVALFIVTMGYSLISFLKSDFLKFMTSLIVSFAGYLLFRYDIHVPLHMGSSMSMMVFFCIGSLLAKYRVTENLSQGMNIIAGLVSLALFFLLLQFYLPEISVANNVYKGNFILNTGLMTLGCLMVLLNSRTMDRLPALSRVLSYIGKNSLSIYVIHTVILEAVYLLFPKSTVSVTGGVIISIFILGTGLLFNLFLQRFVPFALGKQDLIPGRLLFSSLAVSNTGTSKK